MKIQWLTFAVSIDGTRLDRAGCRRVRRAAMQSAIHAKPWIRFAHPAMTLFAAAFGLLIGWTVGQILESRLPTSIETSSRLLLVVAVAAPVMLLIWCAFAIVNRALLQTHMRKAMIEMGYHICPACGYWLKGLPEHTSRCPECGADRERHSSRADSTDDAPTP